MATRIKELKKNLKYIIKPGVRQSVTPFLWGKPGIGKSQAVKQVAQELGIDFIDLRLSQLESSDLRGIPVPDMAAGIARWLPPEFLPFETVKQFKGTKGVLLLDEMNRARTDVLQAAFQLVLDRQVGMHRISNDWYIVAAGNLGAEDKTDVNEFDAALKNRFIHFEIDVNLDDWIEWAEKAKINSDIINFIKGKPSYLYHVVNEKDNVFVTPRSWEKFSDILNSNPEVDPLELTVSLGQNIVNGAASHFIKFLEQKEVVSPSDVINKYETCKKKIKAMQREQLYDLNNQLVDFLSKKGKTATGEKLNEQLENVHAYAKENLEDDIYIAFLQSLTKSCIATGGDWIDKYLKKYGEDSKMVVKILTRKDGK